MAEGWDSPDDLNFDDLQVPTLPNFCKTVPLLVTKEAATKINSNSSGLHAHISSQNTVHLSAIAVGPGTYGRASRVERLSADTNLVSSRLPQSDTQLVFTQANGINIKSSRNWNGARERAGEEGCLNTQRTPLASVRGDPGVVSMNENPRRDFLPGAGNYSDVRARFGTQDVAIAELAGIERVRVAVEGRSSQAMIRQSRQVRGSAQQVNEEHAYEDELVYEANVRQGGGRLNISDKDSHRAVSQTRNRDFDSLTQQQSGRVGSEGSETGIPVPVVRMGSSDANAGKTLDTTQEFSRRELPVASQVNPYEGDCGANVKGKVKAQQEAGSPERESNGGLPYRIPGPAGALQENFRKRTAHGGFKTRRRSFETCSQSDATDFMEGPWITAMDFLDRGVSKDLPSVTISAIKSFSKHLEHIPELVAVIKAVVPNGFGDVSVVLKDPTGTVNGCIHRSVLTDSKYGHGVVPGAVLVLRKVTVFSPNPHAQYLNITMENVYKVFGSEGGVTRSQSRFVKEKTKDFEGNNDKDHAIPSNEEKEMSPEPAGINRRVGEPLVPGASFEHPKHQTVIQHDANQVDANFGNQISVTQSISPLSAKDLQDATLAAMLEYSHELLTRTSKQLGQVQVVGTRTTEEDADEKVTQEAVVAAKAKAAGWDLGEDVELLLKDDLNNFLP